MILINISGNNVTIEIKGFDIIWALKKRIIIPEESIKNVYISPEGLKPPPLRIPGTYIPKIITAGTYYGKGKKEFWCKHFNNPCIVFDLINFKYKRIVVEAKNINNIDNILSLNKNHSNYPNKISENT